MSDNEDNHIPTNAQYAEDSDQERLQNHQSVVSNEDHSHKMENPLQAEQTQVSQQHTHQKQHEHVEYVNAEKILPQESNQPGQTEQIQVQQSYKQAESPIILNSFQDTQQRQIIQISQQQSLPVQLLKQEPSEIINIRKEESNNQHAHQFQPQQNQQLQEAIIQINPLQPQQHIQLQSKQNRLEAHVNFQHDHDHHDHHDHHHDPHNHHHEHPHTDQIQTHKQHIDHKDIEIENVKYEQEIKQQENVQVREIQQNHGDNNQQDKRKSEIIQITQQKIVQNNQHEVIQTDNNHDNNHNEIHHETADHNPINKDNHQHNNEQSYINLVKKDQTQEHKNETHQDVKKHPLTVNKQAIKVEQKVEHHSKNIQKQKHHEIEEIKVEQSVEIPIAKKQTIQTSKKQPQKSKKQQAGGPSGKSCQCNIM